MVKIQKELTHIYHEIIRNDKIAIGNLTSVASKQIELFSKSLALTQDLKRLPFLLGGKVYFWVDAGALYNVGTATLTGLGITVVLLNGSYEDFLDYGVLTLNEKAMNDLLLVAHGTLHYHVGVAEYNVAIQLPPSHWDFEGNIVLFDTITLMIFLDADTNVSVADYVENRIKAEMELEIDWRPFGKGELQEFIMEHIYAKQGD